MKVHDILKSKSSAIFTVTIDTPVPEVVSLLSVKKIGFLVVLDHSGKLAGVLSERDVVHRCLGEKKDHAAMTAGMIMTPVSVVVTAALTDDIGTIMGLMTERKVRHLPVMDGAAVTGVISIGDVIKYILEEKNEEIRALMEYVSR